MEYSICKKNRKNFYIYLFLLFFTIEAVIFSFSIANINNEVVFGNLNFAIIILINFLLLICYRRNVFLFIIFLFTLYSNCSIAFGLYFFNLPVYIHLVHMLPTGVLGYGSFIFAIFWVGIQIILFAFLNKSKIEKRVEFYYPSRPSFFVYTIIAAAIIFILFLSIIYFNGKTAALLEYTSILVLLGYYFANKKNHEDIILTVISIFVVVRLLLMGARITAIQMAFIIFSYYLINKFSYPLILLFFVIGIFSLTFIGFLGDGYKDPTLSLFFDTLSDKMLTNDTSVYAYFAGMRFLQTIDIVTAQDRLTLFINFLGAIFTGNMSSVTVSVPKFTGQYFVHWDGGVFPFHTFFYLGYLGLLLSSFILGLFLAKVSSLRADSNHFLRLFSVYFLFTCTRRYLYGPETLTRGLLLFAVLFYVFKFLGKNICMKPILITTKRFKT